MTSTAVQDPPYLRTDHQAAHLILPLLPHVHAEKAAPIPSIEVLHFERREQVLTVAATNRYSILTVSVLDSGPDVTLDVYAASLSELVRHLKQSLKRRDPRPAHIRVTGDALTVSGPDVFLTYGPAMIDGRRVEFPNYRAIMGPLEEQSGSKTEFGVSADRVASFAAIDHKGELRVRHSKDNRPLLITPASPDWREPLTYRGALMPVRLP